METRLDTRESNHDWAGAVMRKPPAIQQGRVHGNPVADGWAGAVMQKPPRFTKCDGWTDGPTYRPTDLPTDTARSRVTCLQQKK